ncbi:MAG TPA: hypothetical protein VHA82_19585 [Ramlibacter sp.]|uniref:hypothetical protein n=1 Tax=Ramlibacter sp. TaxID=1917967 RepID=UPI002C169AEC|nr:hypothetical protein [Ramlibacter sp.]HVZ46020.1 hypothetical protein [Ramlibacter sp.]
MKFAAALVCTALAGCAVFGTDELTEGAPGVRDARTLAPFAAQGEVHAGIGTKSDVRRALGDANVIPFDSGWEVWVYRWPGADRSTRAATELVLLFDRSGVLRKERLRPGLRD